MASLASAVLSASTSAAAAAGSTNNHGPDPTQNPMYGSEFFRRIGGGAKRARDTWRDLEIRTILPTCRVHMGGALVGKRIYVFGGAGSGRSNHLWVLDLPTMKWVELPHDGSGYLPEPDGHRIVPPGRSGHTVTASGTKLYVFGGEGDPPPRRVNESQRRKPVRSHAHTVQTVANRVDYKDLWVLDTEARERNGRDDDVSDIMSDEDEPTGPTGLRWTEIPVKAARAPSTQDAAFNAAGLALPGQNIPQVPTARRGHSATLIPGCDLGSQRRASLSAIELGAGGEADEIWYYGGAGPDRNSGTECTFSDIFALNVGTGRWRGLPITGEALVRRSLHTATLVGGSQSKSAGPARVVLIGGEGEDFAPPVHVISVRTLVCSRLECGAPAQFPKAQARDDCNGWQDPGWIAGHTAFSNPSRPGQIFIFGGRREDSCDQADQPGPLLRSLNVVGPLVERQRPLRGRRRRAAQRNKSGGAHPEMEIVQQFSGTPRWELVATDGISPGARCGHISVPVLDIGVLLMGGLSTEKHSKYVPGNNYFLQFSYLTVEPYEVKDADAIELPRVVFPPLPSGRANSVETLQTYGSTLRPGEQEVLQRRLELRSREPMMHARARSEAFQTKVRAILGKKGAQESWLNNKLRKQLIKSQQILAKQDKDGAGAPPVGGTLTRRSTGGSLQSFPGPMPSTLAPVTSDDTRRMRARLGAAGSIVPGLREPAAPTPIESLHSMAAASGAGPNSKAGVSMFTLGLAKRSCCPPAVAGLSSAADPVRLGRMSWCERAKAVDAEQQSMNALRWDPSRSIHFPAGTDATGGGGDYLRGRVARKAEETHERRQWHGRKVMPKLPSCRPTEYREYAADALDQPYTGNPRLATISSGL